MTSVAAAQISPDRTAADLAKSAVAWDSSPKWDGAVIKGEPLPRGINNNMPSAAGYVFERCVEHAFATPGTSLKTEFADTRFVLVKNPTDGPYPMPSAGFAHPDLHDTYVFDASSTYEVDGKTTGTQGCTIVLAGEQASDNQNAMMAFARDYPDFAKSGISAELERDFSRDALEADSYSRYFEFPQLTIHLIATAEGSDAIYTSFMVSHVGAKNTRPATDKE